MGISKAMMEKVAIAASRNVPKIHYNLSYPLWKCYGFERFCNSIIFKSNKKWKSNNVTDPNMTRFLMSLDDAVELVLFAFEHGNQGDLFVNKAPAATIRD